jgi:hypothetical protein
MRGTNIKLLLLALIVPLLYSIHWLLHVSAVACHHKGLLRSFWVTWNTTRRGGISYNVSLCGLWARLSWFRQNHDNPAHRPHNSTLYDIPPIWFVLQVTQKDRRSSLMMAGYCRNMLEQVYRIKEWYNQCTLLVISTTIACVLHYRK